MEYIQDPIRRVGRRAELRITGRSSSLLDSLRRILCTSYVVARLPRFVIRSRNLRQTNRKRIECQTLTLMISV